MLKDKVRSDMPIHVNEAALWPLRMPIFTNFAYVHSDSGRMKAAPGSISCHVRMGRKGMKECTGYV